MTRADETSLATKEWAMAYSMHLLDVSELNIDQSYQRSEQRIALIIGESFDPLAFGSIIVGKRKNGKYYIVDGQQRTKGAQLAGFHRVPALVFDSSGPQQEAHLFRLLNAYRKKVSKIEIFRAALRAKIPYALKIQDAVKDSGLEIELTPRKNTSLAWPRIQAIGALERIYGDGESDAIKKVLSVIVKTWHEESDALREGFLLGVHEFLRQIGSDFDQDVFKKKVGSVTAAKLYRQGETEQAKQHAPSGFRRADGVCTVISKCYKRRSKPK